MKRNVISPFVVTDTNQAKLRLRTVGIRLHALQTLALPTGEREVSPLYLRPRYRFEWRVHGALELQARVGEVNCWNVPTRICAQAFKWMCCTEPRRNLNSVLYVLYNINLFVKFLVIC